MAQWVKNPLAMQETQVQFLGWEDPLEKEMAAHSSILVWEIPWTEEPAGLYSPGGQKESNMIEVTQHEQEVKNLYSKKNKKQKTTYTQTQMKETVLIKKLYNILRH